MPDPLLYLVLVFLITITAFFSSAETSYSKVNKIKLKKSAENKEKNAKIANYIVEHFDYALTTTLIGNTLANITASSIATLIAVNLFGSSGVAIATVTMTLLLLVFGELLPKSMASENSEEWSLKIAKFLRATMVIFYPISLLFIKLKEWVIKVSGKKNDGPFVTEQELKYLVENIEEEGVLEKQESEMVQSALMFDEKTVQEILTPRVDMVYIDIEDSFEEIKNTILNQRYSRLPVCRGGTDKIIGIINTRDFLKAMIYNKNISIKKMITSAFFVYKTINLSTLLSDFKKKKISIAIVTDDYGGTLGLVTMEDLLEQIVGDIWDEDEKIEPDWIKINNENYTISGDMPISTMFDLLDFNPKNFECEHKTMGGWALEMFTRIPNINDSFVFEGLLITVKEMDEQRITKMEIHYDRPKND